MEKLTTFSAQKFVNTFEEPDRLFQSLLSEDRTTDLDPNSIAALKSLNNTWYTLRNAIFKNISITTEGEEKQQCDMIKLEDKLSKHRIEQDKLQARLETLQDSYHTKFSQLQNQLSLVKEELLTLQATRTSEEERINHNVDECATAAITKHEEYMKILSHKILDLEKQLKAKVDKHREKELEWREKADQIDEDVRLFLQDCNDEIMKKVDEQKELKHKFDMERDEQAKLQDHFDLIDRDRNIHETEEEILKKVKQAEEEAERMLRNGAVQIQKLFRGKRDRNIFAKIKSKKAKGSKGKKKKGKGKKKK